MESSLSKHPALDLLETLFERTQHVRCLDWTVILFLLWLIIFRVGDGKLWGKADPNAYMWYIAPQNSGQLKLQPRKNRDIGKRLDETVSRPVIIGMRVLI